MGIQMPIMDSYQATLLTRGDERFNSLPGKWDAGQNDIAHVFLTIRQGVADSGQISYSASRTSATGHVDVAWTIMHALAAEPIGKPKGGCVVFIQ